MIRLILRACVLVFLTTFSRAEGVRIGNWPTNYPVTGSVVVTNVPTAGATMSTSVAISSTSVTVLPANLNRKGLVIYNNSTSSIYVAYDVTASTTHFTYIVTASSSWTMATPIYLGVVSAVRAATGDGKLLITELM